MATQVYPSDLTDAEWALLAPLIPPAKPGGRPRSVDIRRMLNGLFSVLRSGCARHYLPREDWPLADGLLGLSASGGWMERGSGCIRTCANWRGCLRAEILPQARRSLTANRSKRWWEGCVALMVARNSPGASVTFSWTPRAPCWRSSCTLPTLLTGKAASSSFRRWVAPFPAYSASGPIKALRERSFLGRLKNTGYVWTWSIPHFANCSAMRQIWRLIWATSQASGSFPSAGSWSGPSRAVSWLGRQWRLSNGYERLADSTEAFIYLVGIRPLLVRLTRP